MRIKKMHWIGGVFALIILISNLIFFRQDKVFFFLIGISLVIFLLPILTSLVLAGKREQELNQQFLEFSRNLAESVKSGTPIGKSIVNMRNKDFGVLSKYVEKLANQISVGIPISKAMDSFAKDIDSIVVKRAITLIREAENAGGEINHILESVANSIYEVEKLKKERKNAISSLVVQGYIIFFIFLGIMLIMEFKILPLTADISSIGSFGSAGDLSGTIAAGGSLAASEASVSAEALARPFLYLLLVQGFFVGLIIGKLSEGSVKYGIKHSIILSVMAFLVSTGSRLFL